MQADYPFSHPPSLKNVTLWDIFTLTFFLLTGTLKYAIFSLFKCLYTDIKLIFFQFEDRFIFECFYNTCLLIYIYIYRRPKISRWKYHLKSHFPEKPALTSATREEQDARSIDEQTSCKQVGKAEFMLGVSNLNDDCFGRGLEIR